MLAVCEALILAVVEPCFVCYIVYRIVCFCHVYLLDLLHCLSLLLCLDVDKIWVAFRGILRGVMLATQGKKRIT
jgi:hypothetical protein